MFVVDGVTVKNASEWWFSGLCLIYQGCRTLTFALARLSCMQIVRGIKARLTWVWLLRCLSSTMFIHAEFLQHTECATNAANSTATQRCQNESIADLLKSFSASQVWNMLAHPAVYCRWERTRSSAVAVIADRTAYDWQTIKPVSVTSWKYFPPKDVLTYKIYIGRFCHLCIVVKFFILYIFLCFFFTCLPFMVNKDDNVDLIWFHNKL